MKCLDTARAPRMLSEAIHRKPLVRAGFSDFETEFYLKPGAVVGALRRLSRHRNCADTLPWRRAAFGKTANGHARKPMVGADLPDQNAKTVGGKRFPVTCLNQICGVVALCCFFNKCYFYNNEQQLLLDPGRALARRVSPKTNHPNRFNPATSSTRTPPYSTFSNPAFSSTCKA